MGEPTTQPHARAKRHRPYSIERENGEVVATGFTTQEDALKFLESVELGLHLETFYVRHADERAP